MATVKDGAVQFTNDKGETVSTGIGNVSFVKAGSRNLAFFGSRGRSELTDDEFKSVHEGLGLPVPSAATTDDDDDLTLPAV